MKTLIPKLFLVLGLLAPPTLVQAQFSFTTNNGAITITSYNTAAGLNAVIPAATNGYHVTSIGESAFFGSSITNVTIPNSVTNIGDVAFYESSITSVTIPNSVDNIGGTAFVGCNSLTNITVAESNPAYSSLGGVLFDKTKATLIQFPAGLGGGYVITNSVTSIGVEAFEYCASLTSVTIPNSVTSMGDETFYYCTSLTNVIIGNSVTSIGNDAFYYCYLLTSVTIPNSVASIGNEAFAACTSLTNVTIPNSVTNIGFFAFRYCYPLTSVTIPNSVTNIGGLAFASCTSLTNVTFLGNAPVLADATEFTDDGIAAKVVYYYAGTSGWGSTYGGLPTVELGASNPPQIDKGSIGVSAGSFDFTVTGVTNQTIVVEASTNLVHWQPVWTNTLSGTSANFTDLQSTNYPRRFYRAH